MQLLVAEKRPLLVLADVELYVGNVFVAVLVSYVHRKYFAEMKVLQIRYWVVVSLELFQVDVQSLRHRVHQQLVVEQLDGGRIPIVVQFLNHMRLRPFIHVE